MKMKEITEKEIELINNSCCNFILIYCAVKGIKEESEMDAVFNKMYNDELIQTFMSFKEQFYPNSEMNEVEYLNFASTVIVETFGEETIKKYLREHNKNLN